MHLRTLFIVSVLSLASGQDRKVTSKLNPDCTSCSENTTLVCVRAEGPLDTIYQLWDFTRGTPTVIYAVSGINSSMTVSWDKDRPVKFNLTEDVKYSFAVGITELIEYNDIKDHGQIKDDSMQRRYPLRDVTWTRQDSILTDRHAMLQMHSNRYKNGFIDVKLNFLPFRDYSVELPHLIHTANSSLLDVQLVNLTTYREYNSSRFALKLLFVSTDDSRSSMVQAIKRSLDDEHTPGEFEIIEIKTPSSAVGGAGGYLQFRPVAYRQRERSVTSSTVVHTSAFNSSKIPIPSTLFRFYREFVNTELLIEDIAVSFGEPGDRFYVHHNYTGWSSTIGYGAPPVETFSLFVILVLSIGLTVPVLLALSGVIYVLVRRCRARNPPVRLDEQ